MVAWLEDGNLMRHLERPGNSYQETPPACVKGKFSLIMLSNILQETAFTCKMPLIHTIPQISCGKLGFKNHPVHTSGILYNTFIMFMQWIVLTHWGQGKMDAILQTTHMSDMTHSNIFSWMKMFEIQLKFHWSLFLRVQLTVFQHWFK